MFSTVSINTDKPCVVGNTTGYIWPSNGFKGVGDSYSISDAWDRGDMEKYAITPVELLKLKSYFDRLNRRSKIFDKTCSSQIRSRRERIRKRFNNAYMSLKQLVVKTRYRYNMRRYIITPPMAQFTHHYDTAVRKLCRLDVLEPSCLQSKKIFIKQNWNKSRSNTTGNKSRHQTPSKDSRQKQFRTTDSVLQRLWKSMNEADLVNKSIKDQTQGGKSFLKQVVVPGKMLNCLYGKVLPDPTLKPHEIGLPIHVMESVFKDVNVNKMAALVKRDPVFSSDAVTTFTKVKPTGYPYISLPSEIITNKQLDFDGDNVTVYFVNSSKCFIETLMRLSPKIGMYCYFYRTRLSFSQTNPFRIGGILKDLRRRAGRSGGYADSVRRLFGSTFTFCHGQYHVDSVARINDQLNDTIVSLSQQYGPNVPYGFVMLIRKRSFEGYNEKRIYPVGPNAKELAMHIAESGSKGTPDGVDNVFKMTTNQATMTSEMIDYAKRFIEVKTTIRKQGHNAKKMDSALQNVIVNHDSRLTLRVNNIVYDLGHIINYMQREWVMSDLTVKCLLNDIDEDENMLKGFAK